MHKTTCNVEAVGVPLGYVNPVECWCHGQLQHTQSTRLKKSQQSRFIILFIVGKIVINLNYLGNVKITSFNYKQNTYPKFTKKFSLLAKEKKVKEF